MRDKSISRLRAVPAILALTLALAGPAAAGNRYKALHSFTGGDDGGVPNSGLAFDAQGNLYGTTIGSLDASSTVFELSPNADGSWTESVLYQSLAGPGPYNIRPGVIVDAAGNLYATSLHGGTYDHGTVFELVNNGGGNWSEITLYSFIGDSDGSYPVGGLVFDSVGNLYGTTTYGGSGYGVVFVLSPNQNGGWTENVIHEFSGADGSYPDHSSLIFDSSGNLYGVTAQGGKGDCYIWAKGCGVVFELTPNENGAWTETVLYEFSDGKNGSNPESTLLFDSAGKLYGTTLAGGLDGNGVVFRLTPDGNGNWSFSVLHHFKGGTDGANPYAGLIFDSVGNLYGSTMDGGEGSCSDNRAPGCGTIYELIQDASGTWFDHILFRFPGKPAANPISELVFDAYGNLYGTDAASTSKGFGGVFELTP
ncbi:MAG TPA: choice-of-anchor tandem repeat GloVer-containing protein [Terriglobales bacterium]